MTSHENKELGSADLYSGRLYRSIRLGLPDRTAKQGLRFIRRSFHVPNLMHKLNVKCYFIVGVIALRHLPSLLNVDVEVTLMYLLI